MTQMPLPDATKSGIAQTGWQYILQTCAALVRSLRPVSPKTCEIPMSDAELRFHHSLHEIYNRVTGAADSMTLENIRNLCDACFEELFSELPHHIEGWENLPEESGHIFIINHIGTNPRYALRNQFEFALDTHFVSAMILRKSYQASPLRVVRHSLADEHAHQKYYERLGHLQVYTHQSALPDPFDPQMERDRFTAQASRHLQRGKNLILCPEGRSGVDGRSPQPFKKGAFHLALLQQRKTMLVPISLAGFGGHIPASRLVAIIDRPVTLQDYVPESAPGKLNNLVQQVHQQMCHTTRRASQLSALLDG